MLSARAESDGQWRKRYGLRAGILESHFISTRAFDILMKKPFTPGDFEKFIEERGDTLRSRIKDLAGQVGL